MKSCWLTIVIGATMFMSVFVGSAPASMDKSQKFDILEKPALFEGDIAGIAPQNGFKSSKEVLEYFKATEKNGVLLGRWPDNLIPYTISDSFTASERQTIVRGLAAINEKATYLRLVPRTGEAHYVSILRGGPKTGCWSRIGRMGGMQELNLQAPVDSQDKSHCIYHGTVIHEMMHAVGFYHEQSRTDRDQYVDINWSNIDPSQHHNFESYSNAIITHFGQPYDYRSVMHYDKRAFAINPSVWTIRAKAPLQDTEIGGQFGSGLSATDTVKLNAMYSNPEGPPPDVTFCARVWDTYNWTGRYYEFITGNSQLTLSTADKDIVSSLTVTFGCTLTLYTEDNFLGNSWYFSPSSGTLRWWNGSGQVWDNKARSGKCVCA